MSWVKRALDKLKKIRELLWSGRPDLSRRPPAPKINSRMLSSCLVYVFRAGYITVYGGIRRLLFPNCSQHGSCYSGHCQQRISLHRAGV
jgi:hypothetical protein